MRVQLTGRVLLGSLVALLALLIPGVFMVTAQDAPTPTPNLQATIDYLNAQLTQQAITSQPPTIMPAVSATATSPLLDLTPVIGMTPLPTLAPAVPIAAPPLLIQLPDDWQYGYFESPTGDLAIRGNVSVAAYVGMIKQANVSIFVLWNYPSIAAPPTPLTQAGTPTRTPLPVTLPPGVDAFQLQIHQDGVRLLKGTVVGITCNVGNYGLRTDLTVGQLPAVGESFNAIQCQGEADVIGWFAGLRQYDRDYLFYVLIEPPGELNNVALDVQSILDTVVFVPPDQQTLTPAPTQQASATSTIAPTPTSQ